MDPITYVSQSEDDRVDKVFVEKLEEVTKKIYETFKELAPMIFDEVAKELHEGQDECYAGGKRFKNDDMNLRKVRDHCHYKGKYRGALHSKCNLTLKRTRTIPVYFHNLTGYDCHLFVKRLADSPGDVNCIPHDEEKYIAFNKRVLVDTITKEDKEVNIYSCLKFVDTLNFMRTSLEKLVMYDEAQRFFESSSPSGSALSRRKFYTDKFACVVDFRTVDDENVSGSGRRVIGTHAGVLLEIEKEATFTDLSCHVFVIPDGIINAVENKLQGVEY